MSLAIVYRRALPLVAALLAAGLALSCGTSSPSSVELERLPSEPAGAAGQSAAASGAAEQPASLTPGATGSSEAVGGETPLQPGETPLEGSPGAGAGDGGYMPPSGGRTRTVLNTGWRFSRSDVAGAEAVAFASDGRDEGEAAGRNDKGLVSYDRATKKDAFYWYKANWSSEPVVYITSRRFTQRTTPTTTVKIYANVPSVELRVNETSLGSKSAADHIFSWPAVALAAGETRIEAIGTRGDETWTDRVTWTR